MFPKREKIPHGMSYVSCHGVGVVVPDEFYSEVQQALFDAFQKGREKTLEKITEHLKEVSK